MESLWAVFTLGFLCGVALTFGALYALARSARRFGPNSKVNTRERVAAAVKRG